MLDIDAARSRRRRRPCLAPTEQFEMRPHRVVGDIGRDDARDARQGCEVRAPLLRNATGIMKPGFIQTFDVRRVALGEVRVTPKMIHSNVGHQTVTSHSKVCRACDTIDGA